MSGSVSSAPVPRGLRALLREELVALLGPDLDRAVRTEGGTETPGVVMVVGVNGTGKTTTTGKLARVLVADGRSVVLGAADTFRAAPPTSSRPGASASAPGRSAGPRAETRRRSPSTP